ncbi:MAG: hypothetical protein CEE40_04290 [Chloroflexi bacterium B3_Chlor]|nr:MAG: hypothetical protein CEE40_04290 [Chloroflexi bacterium B3_Chlor]
MVTKDFSYRTAILSILPILAIGIFLRLYRLDAIPLGLHYDEAAHGVDALGILAGRHAVFFEANNGREPLFIYLVALSIGVLGRSPLAIRVVSAIAGIATIPATYLLVRELFRAERAKAHLLALFSSLWLSTSYWHLSFSRLGYRGILLPLLASLSFYFFLSGWRRAKEETSTWPSIVSFVLSGLFLGAAFYTYIPSRILPMVPACFALFSVLISRRSRTDAGAKAKHVRGSLGLGLLVTALACFLIFVPLGYYFLRNPDSFMQNIRDVSFLNPYYSQANPIATLAKSIAKTFGMFIFQGDMNWRHNPARRAVFDPATSVLFLIGLAISFRNLKKEPYLFTLLWFFFMFLPGALTAAGAPHSLRAIGMLPVACVLPAIGLEAAWRWMKRIAHFSWTQYSVTLLSCALFIFVGLLTYRDYFGAWPGGQELQGAFDVTFVDAVMLMNEVDDQHGVWVLPVSTLADPGSGHYVIEFLYDDHMPWHFLRVDEQSAPERLASICVEKERVYVIDWKEPILREAFLYYADPKGLLPFLLTKYGRQLETRSFTGFQLLVYELPPSPSFSLAQSLEPTEVHFGDQISLAGLAFGGAPLNDLGVPSEIEGRTLPSGKQGWVVLQWRLDATPSSDYKAAIYLVDGRGRVIGQTDKPILGNYMEPTSEWRPAQTGVDYYILPSLPVTPPGEYGIEIAVYDPATMERLPVLDEDGRMLGLSFVAGTFEVVKPLVAPTVEPDVEVVEGVIAPGIRLLGYDFPRKEVEPGSAMRVALYWQALQDIEDDYLLAVELRDGSGNIRAEQVDRPVDGTYPTTEWDEGEVLRDWHDVGVPADTPQGRYEVFLKVMKGMVSLGEASLGEVEVRGRTHYFTLPEMQYSLELMVGDEIRLLGYDLDDAEVRAGEVVWLTLYWQAVGEMDVSYTVFTHLLDGRNQIWAQKDSIPGGGSLPTTSWIEGEVIADVYDLVVDAHAPPGDYALELGMYDVATGQRLPIYDAAGELLGDRVLSEAIRVLP